MNLPAAVAIWAAIVLVAAFWGIRLGYGGLRFAIALGITAALFAFEFFLAAPAVLDRTLALLRTRGNTFAPLVPLFAVLLYWLVVSANGKMILLGSVYVVVPALLVASSAASVPGTWQDYAALIVIWTPVEFRWMYRMFPYPPPLTHTLTILIALSAGVAAFVLLRRLEGIGYAVQWRQGFGWNFGFHFVAFAAIAIPLGIGIGFLTWYPSLARLHTLPLAALGILFFYRVAGGISVSRAVAKSLFAVAEQSMGGTGDRFGDLRALAHFPRSVPQLEIRPAGNDCGVVYGRAWMKTGSLVPGVLVHALVDTSWHVLFR